MLFDLAGGKVDHVEVKVTHVCEGRAKKSYPSYYNFNGSCVSIGKGGRDI